VEEAVTMIITPPFWGTWWFRLLVLLLGIGLIYTLLKLKLLREKKISQHKLKISQMQSQLSQAELKALKAQLHPHFLFNTLNVISSLMHENVEAADHVITRLGDLLRLMFSHSGKTMVLLKDEIEFIKIYLELHQVRFQDKLAVTLDTADDTLEAPVPNFLLQPLVENAVKHGVSKDKHDNKILVRSQKKDNRLYLLIQDNGPGIPQLETGDFVNIKGGFGLKNTLERLKIQYETDFKFKLENSPEGGLIVNIEMPYNTKAQNE
jgi:sensor histidine kinase YesM